MTNRPSFESIYMDMATSLAKRSTCSRRQVGCVIVSSDFKHVYGVGYNGNAIGMPNGCDRPNESGNCGCIHAEENAIINCNAPRLVPPVPKIVFVTVYPCLGCAKKLANLGGIQKLHFSAQYHNEDAKAVFAANNVETSQYDAKGETANSEIVSAWNEVVSYR